MTMDVVAKQLYKSKTNLELELSGVQQWLSSYGVGLERKKNCGIYLTGREEQIRDAFKELCFRFQLLAQPAFSGSFPRLKAGFQATLEKFFSARVLDEVIKIVNVSETNLNESYTDYDYESMLAKLCILIFRSKIGKSAKSRHHFTNSIREFLVAQLMKLQIETCFHLTLAEDELSEMTYYILSSRRQNDHANAVQGAIVEKVIEKFLQLLSVSLNTDLNHDDELKASLFNHLTPAIRRMRYGIKIENPLLTQIKYEYTSVYIAIMTSIEEIEKNENVYFDANELGYICLHIVAAINRSIKKRHIAACLICEGGLTISTFLKSKIERQFSEIAITKIVRAQALDTVNLNDFALFLNSAGNAIACRENMIPITFMLDDAAQEEIRAWMIKKEYQRMISDNHQVRNDILFFKDQVENKAELIKKYCKLLEIDKYVTADFRESVFAREKRAATSLGRGIAVPHGSGAFVKNSVILVLRLEKPIAWDEQFVDLVFLIGINFNESKNYHFFFEKLFKIISDDLLIKKLKKASNPLEMEALLFDTAEKK